MSTHPPLQPRRVVTSTVVIKPAFIHFLARITDGFVASLQCRYRRQTGRAAKRVIAFVADQPSLLIQFHEAGAQVIVEAVAQLILIDAVGFFAHPVQATHAASTSRQGDDV
ncbi:hypothetical protein [Pseudomonas sp. CLCA07]